MSRITLLDGSIGQSLVQRAGDRPTPLWSTAVMLESPDLVAELHGDYFRAGATVATTNTYPVHRDRLVGSGLEHEFENLIDTAVHQAMMARAAFGSGRIAGALGPLGASYRPDLCPAPEEAARLYGEPIERMDPHVDLFLIETVSSVNHAEGALRATARGTRPVWLAVSVMDDDGDHLRSGEHVADLASVIEHHAPQAVLVNCSRPEAIDTALQHIAAFGRPFGAYANGFTRITDGFLENRPTVDALSARRDLGPAAYADFAMGWVERGATIVGGCCEVGPAHIGEIARRLTSAGCEIV